MTTAVSLVFEAKLDDSPWYDADGDPILDTTGDQILLVDTWDAEFGSDVLSLSVSRGIRGGLITDRVARPGKISFELNNSAANHAETLGYWSPKHADVRAGWGRKTQVRVGLLKAGGSTQWEFIGKVDKITPVPGQYGPRRVSVTALDYISDLQEDSEVKRIAILEDATSDEAYTALLAVASTQPEATDFSTGVLTMPRVFHQATGKNVRLYEEIVRIATSNFEYVYVTKDGTLKSQNMVDRLTEDTVQFTLDGTMRDVDVSESAKDIPRKFTITVYPIDIGVSREVVAAISSPVRINPGETVEFELKYRDPNGGGNMAAKNLQTPVANTHYKFATYEDEERQANNYNSKLSLTLTEYATLVNVSATNNGNSLGFLNFFEVKGYAIRTLDEVSRSAEVSGAEGPEVKLNLYYLGDPRIAYQAAQMAVNVYGDTYARSVNFKAHASETILDGFLATDIGERIEVIETVTGEDSEYFVNGITWEYKGDYDIDVTYILGPARTDTPWIVGTAEVGTGLVLFSGG